LKALQNLFCAACYLRCFVTWSTSVTIHKAWKLLQVDEHGQAGRRGETIDLPFKTEEGLGKAMLADMVKQAAAFIGKHGTIWHAKDL
jgi:hypothetical protein